MSTSRQQLLEYVRSHNSVTSSEISQALHMTQANVRYHLRILVESGLVESIYRQFPEGKGRPARFFQPSKKSLGDNLDLLSNLLLKETYHELPPEEKEVFLKRLAENLASHSLSESNFKSIPSNKSSVLSGTRISENTSKLSLTKRLYLTINQLNQLHYIARWEAHKEGPLLIFEHCPYFSISSEHPELCQMDKYLLEFLIQSKVESISKLVKDKRGNTTCNFRIIC